MRSLGRADHLGAVPGAALAVLAVLAGHGLAAAPACAQDTHVLVVVGLSGDPVHAERFGDWAGRFIDAAIERHGVAADAVIYLAENPDADARIRARSTGDNVRGAVEELAAGSAPGDQIFILLIGHGTYARGESRFNLPGPDLSARDFSLLLDRLTGRRVAFIDASSASGGFVEPLSGKDRAIITATKTGLERNEAVFGGYFVDAFAQEGSDLDKDGRVSLLEAFEYARLEVSRSYGQDNKLLTEHAMLDDNGDGRGSAEPGRDQPDGGLAQTMFLGSAAAFAELKTDDPVLRRLYEERAAIQTRVDELRALRGEMDPEVYRIRLEDLLVELALKNREIRAREGGA